MSNLIEANEKALNIAINAVDAFPWHDKAAYAKWLAQTYHYSAHTVSLLSLMVARTNIKTDPALHLARISHSNEEIGHEQWVRQDICALDYNLDELPELPQTRWLWEPQFFKCDHVSVEAVYGYTIILEQLAVAKGAEIANKIKDLAGEKGCNRFLMGHSTADVDHVKNDIDVIKSFTTQQQKHVIDNMFQTAEAYGNLLRAVA